MHGAAVLQCHQVPYVIIFSAEREARQNMLTNEEKEILIEQAKLEREKNRQAKLEKRQKQQEYQNILYR